MPVSRRSQPDYDLIAFTAYSSDQDTRMAYSAKILDLAEAGFLLRLRIPSNLPTFYMEVLDILTKMDEVETAITPLPGES